LTTVGCHFPQIPPLVWAVGGWAVLSEPIVIHERYLSDKIMTCIM